MRNKENYQKWKGISAFHNVDNIEHVLWEKNSKNCEDNRLILHTELLGFWALSPDIWKKNTTFRKLDVSLRKLKNGKALTQLRLTDTSILIQ